MNDNKTAAEEALRRIPAINRTIAEANEKTREAQLALGNAAADATEAKDKAHEAERIASAVQKVSASLFSSPCSHAPHTFQTRVLAEFFLCCSKTVSDHPCLSSFQHT